MEAFDNEIFLWLNAKRNFGWTFHLPTKDYGGFMNLDVCEIFFGGSMVCNVAYVAFWGITVTYGGYAMISFGRNIMRTMTPVRKKCPKCKKGILKEQAFTDQAPTITPTGKKHIYRQFYLTCTCGYSKKSREPELIA